MPSYSAHFWFFRIEQSRVPYMGIQIFNFRRTNLFQNDSFMLMILLFRISAYISPLPPKFCADYKLFFLKSGILFFCHQLRTLHYICNFTSAIRTYGYIFSIQNFNYLCFVVSTKSSQKFTTSDQIPA